VVRDQVEIELGSLEELPLGRVPGVYLLFLGGRVNYVGQAVLPLRRVARHSERGAIPFDSAGFYPSPDPARLERLLVDYCKPPFNKALRGPSPEGSRFVAAEIRRLLGDR
jgi:hypothetical protein